MALTNAQKVDIRRYCGFPVYGGTPVQAFGYRYFQWYGTLEFRMNNLQAEEEAVVTTYLATLATLESDIPTAAANLDTDQAAAWTHNKNEIQDRAALFDMWRNRLCNFFGIPRGPNFGGQGGNIRLVV